MSQEYKTETWSIKATQSVSSTDDKINSQRQTMLMSLQKATDQTSQTFQKMQSLYETISQEQLEVERLENLIKRPLLTSGFKREIAELQKSLHKIKHVQESIQLSFDATELRLSSQLDGKSLYITNVYDQMNKSFSDLQNKERAVQQYQSIVLENQNLLSQIQSLNLQCHIARNEARLIRAERVDDDDLEEQEPAQNMDSLVIAVGFIFIVFALLKL